MVELVLSRHPCDELGLGCCITLVAHCGFSWCYCRLDWLFNAYHFLPVPLEELEEELEAEENASKGSETKTEAAEE